MNEIRRSLGMAVFRVARFLFRVSFWLIEGREGENE